MMQGIIIKDKWDKSCQFKLIFTVFCIIVQYNKIFRTV